MIEYTADNRPILTPSVRATLRTIAQELQADNSLIARVNADVPSIIPHDQETPEGGSRTKFGPGIA